MSLFGNQSTSGPPSAGGLFAGLSVNTNPDPNAKRKSIFDASTSRSEAQAQPGLFSTSNTNPPSSGSSVLGGMSATTPGSFSFSKASTSSVPGPLGLTTTNASSGGLFGAPSTSAPSGGLFGSAPAASQPGGGLFGSTTTAAPSGGLFGARPAPTAASSNLVAGSSLFGSGATATTSQPSTSIFGAPQQPAQQAQQTGLPGEASGPQTRDGGYFSSLLERQKKKARLLPTEQNGRKTQLPALNMDLGDLARRAQEIGGRGGVPDSQASDSRAHYLLAGSGVPPGRAYREFQALDEDEMQIEPRGPLPDASVETETYIKNLQSKGRDAMMRESMDRVYREVDDYIEQTLGIDLEEQKLRIMKHFGLVPENDDANADSNTTTRGFGKLTTDSQTGSRSVFGRSGLNKSIIGTPGTASGTASFFKADNAAAQASSLLRGQTARDLRDKERLFVDHVQSLNQARIKEERFAIMTNFGEVEAKAAGDSPVQLAEAYSALEEITKESGGNIAEGQYASLYVDTEGGIPSSLSRQIIDGSRTYLEKSFYREVESTVEKNPREGQLGGRPTVINKIRAYIRVRAARKNLAPDGAELQQIGENGDYCWILIFLLLRCGFIKEAAEYVNNDAAFQSTDRRFVSYMSTYATSPDRRLSRKLQEMIDGEYQQRAKLAPKGTVDPYRMACYKVVGRCDLSSRNLETVGQGVEDWLWLQFVLARQQLRDEELTGDVYGLEQIQETIWEIGDKHFQKAQVEGSNAYGTFFLMQILAGMFEQAVDYLHAFNSVSSVHFAIALSYYGLLRISNFNVAGNELLTKASTDQYSINFVPLIAHYTATFRTALPVAAVDYLCLICLYAEMKPAALGKVQVKACHECLRELCLESREFAMLLGDIRNDGTRFPGAIEQRARLIKIESRDEFLKSITIQSAAIADQRGQVADAVLLYHLCEDYDNVVKVLNHTLADAISLDLGESPMQLQPLKPRQSEDQVGSSRMAKSGPTSSLSLTQSSASPIELAKNMSALYDSNASYYKHINSEDRTACGVLLKLLAVRAHLEGEPPQYLEALEELNELNIVPLRANSSISTIRNSASMFGTLHPLVARCVGISIVWAVRAIGGERERIIRHGSWETGHGGDRDGLKDQLGGMAKDLMMFAGLVKYKLPARVFEMLSRVGGDVGSY